MNKLILAGVSALTIGLSGCSTIHDVGNAGGAVVGTGVGFVTTAGSTAIGTVEKGVGVLVGSPASRHDVKTYNHKGVVYHNGHAYHIKNGRYVLVH